MTHGTDAGIKLSSILKITGAYIAFLIGSGFATGQEAMQFFVAHGFYGIGGALLVLCLHIYVCSSLLKAGQRFHLSTNEAVFVHYCGSIIGKGITWYVMIFIIAVHALMLAGSGATLQQSYGIPIYIGVAAMALMTAGTLLLGLNRIIDIIGIIGPVLILITVIISTLTIINNADHIVQNAERASKLDILRASPNWVASGFLYFGLTLPGLASFLPAIGNTVSGKAEISYASILGPCLYISAMILVILALTSSIDSVNGSMIPTMLLAQQFFPMFGAIFAVIIFLGIYTTTTPLVWTVCARFSEEGTTKYYSLVFLLTTVSAFGGVMLPFDKLVNLIYPTVGYAGLLFFSCAVITDTRIWLKRDKFP